jgi:hypothetical protein
MLALTARRTLPPAAAWQDVEGEQRQDDDRRNDSDHGDGRGGNEHPYRMSGQAFGETLT